MLSNYHANHLIYEVERAGANIEILETFNKQAKYMTKHDQFEYVEDMNDRENGNLNELNILLKKNKDFEL